MQKTCESCQNSFELSARELDFLKRMEFTIGSKTFHVPPPRRCPACRLQVRMAWRNERNLFSRPCSLTGSSLISMFPPTTKFPVYNVTSWWSDQYDGLKFGKDIDWNKPVSVQMAELINNTPRVHIFTYSMDRLQNSLFTNCTGDLKNCYLIFAAARNENCMYSNSINDCFNCVDCFFLMKCTNCYECTDLDTCHSVFWSDNCKECNESLYIFDCRGCSNCIGCAGLRQKRYHVLNEEVSKAEFERVKSMILRKSDGYGAFMSDYEKLLLSTPRKYLHGDKNEGSTGDFIWNTKQCLACYDTYNAEDCMHCTWFSDGKDSMDVYAWGETELCYQISGGGDSHYHCAFTSASFGCKECWYVDLCVYSKDCFACVGLKNAQYCIFNKQYSKADYESNVIRLIEKMQADNEWGEMFDTKYSPVGYNYSVAKEYFPLEKSAALNKGFRWEDYESPTPNPGRLFNAQELQGSSKNVSDEILNGAVACEKTNKIFRLTKAELTFYRDNDLSIPLLHPDERHALRLKRRNPRNLWERFCESCGDKVQTSYAPDRPELVFCEDCYHQKVYG